MESSKVMYAECCDTCKHSVLVKESEADSSGIDRACLLRDNEIVWINMWCERFIMDKFFADASEAGDVRSIIDYKEEAEV